MRAWCHSYKSDVAIHYDCGRMFNSVSPFWIELRMEFYREDHPEGQRQGEGNVFSAAWREKEQQIRK